VNPVKEILESLLKMARRITPNIFESEDFGRSNMGLAGHIFLRLSGSGLFKREHKILNESSKDALTRGARRISEVVAEEYLKDTNCNNDYELRVLEAIKKRPAWDFQVSEALGCRALVSSGVISAIQSLEGRGVIYRGEDFKYYVVEKHNPFEVHE